MNANCIIVDDEPLARELLESHISKFPQLNLVASCENAIAAHGAMEKHGVDLIFLDIEMPLLKGNSFLKGLIDPPAVVITTAHREYAVEGYEMNVVDYLLKPIVFDRFFTAVDKFIKQRTAVVNPPHEKEVDCIYMQSGNKHIKILLKDIRYVESTKDYITIYLENAPDLHIKHNISAFEKLLDDRFLRVHRSFIVNKNKISSFSKFELWIDTVEVPIGDSFRDNWKTFLKDIDKAHLA